jgi:ABC-type glycerol-3-phosphate transport system permease component
MTFAIMIFLGRWNEYWANYLYFQNYPTIAVGVALLSKRNGKDVEKFATMVVSIIPVLAMYAIFQKQLMRNTIGGGLKG